MKVISPWDMTETNLRNEILSGKNQTTQKFSRVTLAFFVFRYPLYILINIHCCVYLHFQKFIQIQKSAIC